jgi:hypothetical protein
MSLYAVTLVAEDIQVTAPDEAEAERYARSDARQFRGQWDFQRTEALPADADAEESDGDDVDPDVSLTERPDAGAPVDNRIWTFEASFEAVVEADGPETAIAAAKVLLQH